MPLSDALSRELRDALEQLSTAAIPPTGDPAVDPPCVLQELIRQLAEQRRLTPDSDGDAGAEFRAQFVDDLAEQARRHRAVHHPYLKDLATGNLPDPKSAIVDFARHYHGYSSHFPRYLTAVISRLDNPEHRRALLNNLTEESGNYDADELAALAAHGVQAEWIVGIPHPELFRRFRDALGVDPAPLGAPPDHIEVVCWRELLLDVLSHGSPAEAVGALGLGTETIVQTIYEPFVQAIDRLGCISPRDSVFFPLHTAVDDHHQATLNAIAADFAGTPQGRHDLSKGMHKALALRDSFWTWLHGRALAAKA